MPERPIKNIELHRRGKYKRIKTEQIYLNRKEMRRFPIGQSVGMISPSKKTCKGTASNQAGHRNELSIHRN